MMIVNLLTTLFIDNLTYKQTLFTDRLHRSGAVNVTVSLCYLRAIRDICTLT